MNQGTEIKEIMKLTEYKSEAIRKVLQAHNELMLQEIMTGKEINIAQGIKIFPVFKIDEYRIKLTLKTKISKNTKEKIIAAYLNLKGKKERKDML
ncbi:MAG: hypothetical protein KBA07_09335 [Petrotogaceae bacterium]|jgi:hypothetical protein|nr:hypothetical protein [Petrotogaceae bacterium]